MRHIWSLIAGLVAAPLVWLLLATGQASSSALIAGWVAAGRGWDTHDLIEPAAFLVVAAVLLGLIATLRISPAGALVAGLLLISGYVATFIDPLAVRDALPNDWVIADRAVPLHVPLDNGTLAVLGVLLLVAPFSVQRWRQWPVAAAAPAAPAAEPEAPEADRAEPDAPGEDRARSDAGAPGEGSADARETQELRRPQASPVSPAPTAPPAARETQELRRPQASPVSPAPAAPPAARESRDSREDLSRSNEVTQELRVVTPRTPVAAAPPPAAAPRKPAVPLTPASVAVPGPVVESPAAKRATPHPGPTPSPQPRPAPTEPRKPAPADPSPEEPPVPSARRPESPWSEPPTGNRTRTPN